MTSHSGSQKPPKGVIFLADSGRSTPEVAYLVTGCGRPTCIQNSFS